MSDRRWPVVVAALLGAHLLACLAFIYLATSDPSLAVEEDYYQKGLAWDEHQRQAATNAALGWRVRVNVATSPAPGAPVLLRLTLNAADGSPVDGAAVSGEAFAVARSATTTAVTGQWVGPGIYDCSFPARRGGLWELRLLVQRGGDRFTAVERVVLPPPSRR